MHQRIAAPRILLPIQVFMNTTRCVRLSLQRSHRVAIFAPSFLRLHTALPHSAAAYRPYANMSLNDPKNFFDFAPKDKRSTEHPLSQYRGKVVLAVNTASKCGFTPQFAGLEKLWKDIHAKHPDDFVILGFPCNQFAGQDPGSNDDIQEFCQLNYGVTFPVLGKTDVNGDKAEPVWEWMKAEKPGIMGLKRIKWNFEKFLIGRDGKVVNRWASTAKPETLEKDIMAEIAKGGSAKV